MTGSLWIVLALVVLTGLGLAAWVRRVLHGGPAETGYDEPETRSAPGGARRPPRSRPAAAPGDRRRTPRTAPQPGPRQVATNRAFDPREWVLMGAMTYRRGWLRGALGGALALGRAFGEPDYHLEHADGTVAVAWRMGEAYPGRPDWPTIAVLTMQMGVASKRWPDRPITGLLRYTDRSVEIPYSERLFEDLRAATQRVGGQRPPMPADLAPVRDAG